MRGYEGMRLGVPFSKAQYFNEVVTMGNDYYELWEEPSTHGEAMEEHCENEKDIPSEYQRDLYKEKGKLLQQMDSEPIDFMSENNIEGEKKCMYDFIADDIEYADGTRVELSSKNKFNRSDYIFDYFYVDTQYEHVDVHSLYECQNCPLHTVLDRKECYPMQRKNNRNGYFFPFDMRTVRFDSDSVLKIHIDKHIANNDIEKVVKSIDGRKVSGFFIETDN